MDGRTITHGNKPVHLTIKLRRDRSGRTWLEKGADGVEFRQNHMPRLLGALIGVTDFPFRCQTRIKSLPARLDLQTAAQAVSDLHR